MSGALVIATRELRDNLLQSMRAYVVASIFLLLSGAYFYAYLVETRFAVTSIAGFIQAARLLTVVFAAILTMGQFAEDRRSGAFALLLTSPVRDIDIVLGKYLSCFVGYCAMLAMTLYYPFLLFLFGAPEVGPIATSYVGLMLLGALCLAIGLFAASAGGNQIVSAALSLVILFTLYYLGEAARILPDAIAAILVDLSLASRFSNFSRGVIDSADVVYYLTLTGAFLYLAADNLSRSRWR